jgi:multimeric flavodoxin WrbA
MAKILGISGSPRRGGNSETVLDCALEGAASAGACIEKIILNEFCLKPCQGCEGCRRTGACVVKDEMRAIYRKVDSSDGLIIASPIYFGSVSAQLKIMIDRFQPYWVRKHILKRPSVNNKKRQGIIICVGGADRQSSFKNASSVVRNLFATLDIEPFGSIFYSGIDKAVDMHRKFSAMKRSYRAGAKLVREEKGKAIKFPYNNIVKI